MRKTALITGASSGIGAELATIHASKGDDLILVARSSDTLAKMKNDLEAKHAVAVHVLVKDLSESNAAQSVFDYTISLGLTIDYLINNAGFGLYGTFDLTDWRKEEKMIQLNVMTLTHLCKLYIPQMIDNGGGKILNVASTAAFQPGPLMAVYYATKAFVLHFSEAINEEVKNKGVTVTALCPGATKTEFFVQAKMESSKLIKGKKLPTAKRVAEYGYRSMMKGKSVAIHGVGNWLLANSVRFSPRWMVVKMVKFIQRT